MIQRIQTIYLLVVAIIMTIPLYVPIAQLLIPNDASYNFFTYGVVLIGENSVLQAHYWALLIRAFKVEDWSDFTEIIKNLE